MLRLRSSHIILIFIGLLLLIGIIYWLPPVHRQLSWRVDFALTYLYRLVNPVEALPTALPEPQMTIVESSTETPSYSPTSSPTLQATAAFTPTPQASPTPLPASVSLLAPKWERQDINNCGPASLTMYLRFYGWEGDQTDIAEVLKPFREDRNVNVEELEYYVRTHTGWLNVLYRVGGDLELLERFLAAGIPVMIEESFYFEEPFWSNDDLWAAHYLLVTGYDNARQVFTGQDSFYGADRKVNYRVLDEYWQAFNRVYILIYLPHQEETVKEILGPHWDADFNRKYALEVAEAETQSDPQNAFTWFNLGTNRTYFEDYFEATKAYDKARELSLPQRMLRYQFGPFIAYFHANKMEDLVALTEYALEITPTSEEAWLWHGWAMFRLGNKEQAISDFLRALERNPNYLDAQYALEFVRSSQ